MDYKSVKISEDAKIARQSVVIGDVTIGRDSCVLHYAVIRGDDAPIVIGEESNVQENCTIHVSRNMPVHIGNNVTVGHNAVLHGCMIGDRTLIGMGAVVLGLYHRSRKSCDKEYSDTGRFSGDGKSCKD